MTPNNTTESCYCQQLKVAVGRHTMQHMVAASKQDFADRLRAACDEVNIPAGRGRIAELHRRMRQAGLTISAEAIRKWLDAESIPSMNNARILATVVNQEVEYLLSGRGSVSLARPGYKSDDMIASKANKANVEDGELLNALSALKQEQKQILIYEIQRMLIEGDAAICEDHPRYRIVTPGEAELLDLFETLDDSGRRDILNAAEKKKRMQDLEIRLDNLSKKLGNNQ